MKAFFSIIFCVTTCLVARAQSVLFGKYSFQELGVNKIKKELCLNCDSTFIMTDSSKNLVIKGKWAIKNDKELVLLLDPTLKSGTYAELTSMFLLIKGNQLHNPGKIETRRQYDKRNRKLNREMTKQTGERQRFESYEEYKKRQENSYFLQTNILNCR